MMTVSDQININLNIGNLNSFALSVKVNTGSMVTAGAPVGLVLPTASFSVKAKSTLTKTITLKAYNITQGPVFVTIGISASSNNITYTDSLTAQITVLPKGFPRQVNQGGAIGSQVFDNSTPTATNFTIKIPTSIEAGSANYSVKLFSSNFASLLEAVQALIQDPSGCFEQTSSTTYPMVMALQFLMAQPTQDSKI